MKKCTKLVGIINITSDSFSDRFEGNDTKGVYLYAKKLLSEGVDIIDIGAQSSNPNSKNISEKEEWNNLKDSLKRLFNIPNIKLSLDSSSPYVAEKFLSMGGYMLNDYSGFSNPEMISIAARFGCYCVVNHFPANSIEKVHSMVKINSLKLVKEDLLQRKKDLISSGICKDKIILDPGIGFGKSKELNRKLLEFKKEMPDESIYIGYSRKAFLGGGRFGDSVNRKAGLLAIKCRTDYIRLHKPSLLNK